MSRIVDEPSDWSEEAAFCTIRTLLCLELVRVQDVVECVAQRAAKIGA
jgi:hypothetical protein